MIFPSSVRDAQRGRKVQQPFVPRQARDPHLQDNAEHHVDEPPREKPATVQHEEVEVEHEGLRPLQPIPAVKGSQTSLRDRSSRENL